MKVILVPESFADALGVVMRDRRGKSTYKDVCSRTRKYRSKGELSIAAVHRAETGQSDIKLRSLYELFGKETPEVVREAIELWESHKPKGAE
jgi:hypothetical protein